MTNEQYLYAIIFLGIALFGVIVYVVFDIIAMRKARKKDEELIQKLWDNGYFGRKD